MPPPVLVQFGAGNIGRGFIAPTFAAAGWSVTFIDIDRPRIAALRSRGSYEVREADNAGVRAVVVRPVTGIEAGDEAAVSAAVAGCALAATAVGLGALPAVGRALARGLERRLADGGGPLDVLVCENGAQAATLLREAVAAQLPAARREGALARLGLVRTSIGRMIPAPAAGADALDIAVEPYAHLPVERAAFRGPIPPVRHLDAVDDFVLEVERKLYLHNLTHACLAYAGHLAGHATIPQCMDDAALVAGAAAAAGEASQALVNAHGHDEGERAAVAAANQALIAGLFLRYRNLALNDPVARVARDPMRKLAGDDRLVGAGRLCLAHGVVPTAIARHVVLACRYTPQPEEPGAAEWLRLRAGGIAGQLAVVAGLTAKEPLMSLIAAQVQP